jgi:hypothetical protein
MKRYLFVLTIVLVISTCSCSSQPLRINLHHTTGTTGPTAVALTAEECKDLGGTVEDNRTCESGRQCRTVIHNPVTPTAPESKTKCLEKAQ